MAVDGDGQQNITTHVGEIMNCPECDKPNMFEYIRGIGMSLWICMFDGGCGLEWYRRDDEDA